MTHRDKITAMMARSGMNFHQCNRRMGRAGALAAARNKRQRATKARLALALVMK